MYTKSADITFLHGEAVVTSTIHHKIKLLLSSEVLTGSNHYAGSRDNGFLPTLVDMLGRRIKMFEDKKFHIYVPGAHRLRRRGSMQFRIKRR